MNELMRYLKNLERRWPSRLLDWIGGALVGALITIPISQYYYDLSAHDSVMQMRRLKAVIQNAVRSGLVEEKFNAQGKIVSLQKPNPPQSLRIE